MATHSIEVTGISDELLEALDRRVRSGRVAGRSEYLRELLARDLAAEEPPSGWPSPDMTFDRLLAPLQREAERSGESEAEIETFVLEQVRAERRGRGSD